MNHHHLTPFLCLRCLHRYSSSSTFFLPSFLQSEEISRSLIHFFPLPSSSRRRRWRSGFFLLFLPLPFLRDQSCYVFPPSLPRAQTRESEPCLLCNVCVCIHHLRGPRQSQHRQQTPPPKLFFCRFLLLLLLLSSFFRGGGDDDGPFNQREAHKSAVQQFQVDGIGGKGTDREAGKKEQQQ